MRFRVSFSDKMTTSEIRTNVNKPQMWMPYWLQSKAFFKVLSFIQDYIQFVYLPFLIVISSPWVYGRRSKASYTRPLRMVRKRNACMCGWDCVPALCHLQMICILFATNRNLSIFYANSKRIGCAGCPLLASGSQKIN